MSGIFAYISTSPNPSNVSKEIKEQIKKQMKYRGVGSELSYKGLDLVLFGVPQKQIYREHNSQIFVIGALHAPDIKTLFKRWQQSGISALSAINGSCIILIIEQGVDHFKKINFYRTPDGISSLYFFSIFLRVIRQNGSCLSCLIFAMSRFVERTSFQ